MTEAPATTEPDPAASGDSTEPVAPLPGQPGWVAPDALPGAPSSGGGSSEGEAKSVPVEPAVPTEAAAPRRRGTVTDRARRDG